MSSYIISNNNLKDGTEKMRNGQMGEKSWLKNLSFRAFRDNIKDYFQKIRNSEVSNHDLAFGFGLGSFIAILPTPGFGIFIAISLAYIFRRINKPSILFSFAVWNPLLLSPIHFFSYKLGTLIHPDLAHHEGASLLQKVSVFAQEYLFGNFILAITLAVISYFVIYKVVDVLKKKDVLLSKPIQEGV
ncbi:DUF2062 domain-containing protein [Cytophagaceae bacterium ABcell3]|nr:DUF2062 domain-containing protein [Cytophagaceae bacterium ABcell3]